MTKRSVTTRRQFLAGAGTVLAAAVAYKRAGAQEITDLQGWDPLWRDAEAALRAFFGTVDYLGHGLAVDLPRHADVGSSVPLTVSFPGETTEAMYPRVVHVLAHGNPTPHVLSVWMTPGVGKAEFSTRIRLERSQIVTVAAQMSDGRHIRIDRDISVSFGACAQIGTGSNDDVRAFQPVTRVSVPATAHKGEIIPVRALIAHPMETGLRVDATEEWIRERIISNFTCRYNGAELFTARPYPAIATNPYFAFFARAEKSGHFDFSWYDTQDLTFTDRAEIDVL
jgi:thiosulfate oxidation carrier complex protein SoxZ